MAPTELEIGGETAAATVFIVENDAVVRRMLTLLVQSVGFAVELYSSADQYLAQFDPARPGCLLLDVRMPGLGGLELQQRLLEYPIRPPIIFISGYGEVSLATRALRAGALDFLQKPFSRLAILERVYEAMTLDQRNRQERRAFEEIETQLSQLNEIENTVLDLLASGVGSRTIAARLSLSAKEVTEHRAKIFETLKVENDAMLAALVLRHCPDRLSVNLPR